MNGEYVFDDKNKLVRYLYSTLSNPTQIKVQKTLYLLYAFYGATYGRLSLSENKEDFQGQYYPKELFPATFQAWRYGPVEYDVYRDEKSGLFNDVCEVVLEKETPEMFNIVQFIDDLVSQTDKIDDFSLVDRTHQDDSWVSKYVEGSKYIEMNNEQIIQEYLGRYI